jgi:hypothetical protein
MMSESNNSFDFESFSLDLSIKRKRARQKAFLLTFIPFLAGLFWLVYCGFQVGEYEKKVAEFRTEISNQKAELVQIKSLDSILSDSIRIKKEELRKVVNDVVSKSSISPQDSIMKTISQYTPAIVFIQVANSAQKTKAMDLKKQIQNLGYTVPQIEVMGRSNFTNHIIYYNKEDSVAAYRVFDECNTIYNNMLSYDFVNNGKYDIMRYSGQKYKAEKGQIEVWINQ